MQKFVITCAENFDEDSYRLLVSRLSQRLPGAVFEQRKNPALLGGFLLQNGEQIIDCTLDSQLNLLQKQMKEAL